MTKAAGQRPASGGEPPAPTRGLPVSPPLSFRTACHPCGAPAVSSPCGGEAPARRGLGQAQLQGPHPRHP